MTKSKKNVDPEVQRFYNDYPTFPGVQICVELLHRRNVRGAYLDCVCAELTKNAVKHISELIHAFQYEDDRRVKALLLAAIAEADSEEAIPILEAQLTGDDVGLRPYAAYGLTRINTKESRRILWQASTFEFEEPEETAEFRQMLEKTKSWKSES